MRKASDNMRVYCWGSTSHGQLGLGAIEEDKVLVPTEIHAFRNRVFREIGCGQRHTVFLMEDGTVFTCGTNEHGELGHDKGYSRPEQVTVLETYGITQVACGSSHTVVLTNKGQVLSWGQDHVGQCGWATGNKEDKRKPKLLKSLSSYKVAQVACGTLHNIVLTKDGKLFTWGDNNCGQLGLGRGIASKSEPTEITSIPGLPISQVACGAAHTFVLTFSGTLFGWGKNEFGQLGLGDDKNRYYPTLLKSLRSQKVKYISCGEDHTAMITAEGGVFTFGAGGHGRLGHNATNSELNPRKVFEFMGSDIGQVACGRKHTLAYVPNTRRMYSFGLNASGQLGLDTTPKQFQITPALVNCAWVSNAMMERTNSNNAVEGDKVMEVEENITEKADVVVAEATRPQETLYLRAMYTGGFQCFCVVSQSNDTLDFRIAPEHKRIATIETHVIPLLGQLVNDQQLSSEVKKAIEMVFDSAACLNASLLTKNDAHLGSNRQNHGVDLDAAREAFQIIAKYPPVVDVIGAAIHHLAPLLPTSPPDIEALRLYLLLMECPFLDDPSKYASCSAAFGQALLSLQSAGTKVVSQWWSIMQPRHLNRILGVYKRFAQYILTLPVPSSGPVVHLQTHLKISLGVISKLNQVNAEHNEILPYYLFYIPEIAKATDLKSHFVEWLMQGGGGDEFNFCDYPFVFDAQSKTILLEIDAVLQMRSAIEDVQRRNLAHVIDNSINPIDPCLVLHVSRTNIVHSTLDQLTKQGSADFKKPLKIVFQGEEAVDAGGVKKEFFMLILKEILDPKYGMFRYYETSRTMWFNNKSFEDPLMFGLVGIICGLAIYNHIIVTLPFPLALYKKLLNRRTVLEDYKQLDPVVASSLQSLLDYEGNDVQDVFGLVFQLSEELFGGVETVDLKAHGPEIPVTAENKQEYVDTYLEYILNKSVERQFGAFSSGFLHVCGGKVLNLFHPQELMDMVIGDENYDWEEFEKSVTYKNEFYRNHPTICLFWEVFKEMTLEQKKKFLIFLTGSDRIPIQGMKSLRVIIQPVKGGTQYIPVAHTCFNLLDLPLYETKEQMKSNMLTAIEYSCGFGLM